MKKSDKTKEEIQAKAEEMWANMDDNQKYGVRFGMFPAEVMKEAAEAGFPSMAVPLMDVAKANGGMKA